MLQPSLDSLYAFGRCISDHDCKTGLVIELMYLIKAKCAIRKIRAYGLWRELGAALAQGTIKFKYHILT